MRMKMVCDDRTLRDVANEFLALKKAQKVRERTLSDYKKYIDKFLAQSQNTLDVDVLKIEILEYFADIPKTSPARFNHPYQYLHALFEWCAKQDYLPYNPFEKLELKKIKDEGNVQPATIGEIQAMLKCLDKHNYTELRDYNIILLMLDTGIRTSELMALRNGDYDPEAACIHIRQENNISVRYDKHILEEISKDKAITMAGLVVSYAGWIAIKGKCTREKLP